MQIPALDNFSLVGGTALPYTWATGVQLILIFFQLLISTMSL
jgi:hypothetical protein